MKSRKTVKKGISVPIVEALEPRLLFSADPLSSSIGALLLPDETVATNDHSHVLHALETVPLQAPLSDTSELEIVFVGADVDDVQALKDSIQRSVGDRTVEIYTIAVDVDGVAYIDSILAEYSSVAAVHIVTHGSTAGVDLGNVRLNSETLDVHSDGLEHWRSSLTSDADILFYGCNLAATNEGVEFLQEVGRFTGADVSASEDITGSRLYNGNWELEYQNGDIQTEVIIADSERSSWRSVLADIVVNTGVDNVDVDADLSSVANLDLNPGADGLVSLREAILAANNDVAVDNITLLPDTYVLDDGQILITNAINFFGDTAANTILDANAGGRHFQIQASAGNVSFTDLTMTGGFESNAGAALFIDAANVTIDNVIFQGNETDGDHGGAIYANTGSTLTVSNSAFDGNTADKDGGAIYSLGNTTIDRVDFTGNSADHGGGIYHVGLGALFQVDGSYFFNNETIRDGGGIVAQGDVTITGTLFEANISNDDGGALALEDSATISNSTFYGNNAADNGGAIHIDHDPGTVTIDSVTFVNNTASDDGGAIHNDNNAVVELTNSLFEGNTGTGNKESLSGKIVSTGFNLIDTNVHPTETTLTDTDRTSTSSNVGNLEDNGGPQKTVSLNSDSPAINTGSSMSVDATGQQRNEIADIGSFEYRGAAPLAKFYWTDHDPSSIHRSDLDGREQQEIYRDADGYFPFDVEVDAQNGFIYWAESQTQLSDVGEYGRLMQARMDGSDPTVLLTGLDNPTGVAVDSANGRIYFTVDATTANSQTNDAILRYNLADSTVDTIYSAPMGVHRFYDVEYDEINDMLYWSDYGESATDLRVFRKDLGAGTPVQTITPQAGQNPLGLTVNPATGDLSWLNGDRLSFYDESGGTVQNNGLGLGSTIGIQYYEGTLYYTDTLGGIGSADETASALGIASITGGDPIGIAVSALSSVSFNPILDINVPGTVVEGGQLPLTELLLSASDDDTADADIIFTVQSQSPTGGEFRNQLDAPVTTFSMADIKAGNIYFQHDGSQNVLYNFSIDVSDGDPDTISVEGANFTINVTLVNDPPVGTSKTMSVDEDGQIDLVADDFGFTDPLDPSAGQTLQSVTITTVPANGTLWLGAQIPANVVTDGQVVLEADLATLSYRPAADGNGIAYDTIGFRVTDSSGDTDTTTRFLTIDVTSVNDAPVGTNNTLSVEEDDQLNLVAGDFGFTDPKDIGDGHTLQTVTIMTVPTNGTLWLGAQIPANVVTNGQVVIAADIATLSYRPPSDANGTAYDTIGFRVTDNAGGTDTDATTRTLTIDVTAVNDAPVGTNNTLSVAEDDQLDLVAGDFGFTDPQDVGNGHTLQSVTIMTAPTKGTLWLGAQIPANVVTNGQVVLAADIATLSYRPVSDANGLSHDTIGFRVTDNAGGADTDSTTRTLTIDVTAVNDAPVGTNNTLSVAEEDQLDLVAGDFGFTDPLDAGDGHTLQSVTIITAPTNGTLWLGAQIPVNVVTDGQVVLVADIATLSYRPATDANGLAHDTIGFRVTDNAGGADTDTTTRTLTIDVTAVNDAPVGTNNTLSVAEEGQLDLVASDFGFTDPQDVGAGHTLQSVTIMTVPANGTLWLGAQIPANVVTDGQVVLAADIATLSYRPATDANGLTYDTLGFRVTDNAGGADTDTTTRILTIDVTAVNDAPVGTSQTLIVAEDDQLDLVAGDFGFTDPQDVGAGHTLQSVTIITAPTYGTLWLGAQIPANEVTNGQLVLAADIATLSYRPAADANGNAYDLIGFRVTDNAGGTDTDTITRFLTIDVTAVNDTPVGTDNTLSVAEEDQLDLVAGDFGFTDPQDPGAGHTLQSVTIMTAPVNGTLWLGAQTPANVVTDGQVVLAADIANLSYRSATDGNGVAYDTIGFRVIDNGGGTDTDTTTRTLTIDVTAVNDTPVGTDNSLSVAEDDQLDLAVGDFGFTDPQDVGSGHTLQSVTIMTAPINGTLWLGAQIPANVVTAGQVVLAADIATLSYRPAADANGIAYDIIGFRVTDNAGGADTDTTTRTLTIDVTAVNDAPVGTNNTLSVEEEGQLDLVAGDFGFTDPIDAGAGHTLQSVTIMTAPANGTLWLGEQTPANVVTDGQVVLVADISTLSYRPPTDANGAAYDTIGFRVTDNAGGAATDTVTRVLTIDVGEVNDAPFIDDALLLGISEDTSNPNGATIDSLFGSSFSDNDSADQFSGIAVVVNPQVASEGRWQYSFDGIDWNDIGDVDSSNALILDSATSIRFLSALNYHGTPTPLVVRGLDDTQAAHSVVGTPLTVNLAAVGGTTPISADTNTLGTTISAVSDAPLTSPLVVNVGEDLSVTLTASHFGFSDPADGDLFSTVSVATVPVNGELILNNVVVDVGDSIAVSDINAGLLSYRTEPDLTGNGVGSFSFQLVDSGVIPPGANTSLTDTLTINVTPAADAPTILDATLASVNEDSVDHEGETLQSLFAAGFTDPDVGESFFGVAVVGNVPDAEKGDWQYSTDGLNWNSIGSTTPTEALILEANTQIRFLPVADYFGSPLGLQVLGIDSSFTGAFTDELDEIIVDTATAITGGSISLNTVTINTVIDAVDDKPSEILLSQNTIPENVSGVGVGMISVVDVDGSPSYTYEVNDPRFVIVDEELRLTDAQALDFESESEIPLTISVTDAAGDTGEWDIILAVQDVNDEPSLAAALEVQTLFEGSSFIIPESLFVDQDADDTLSYTAFLPGTEQAPLPSWLVFNEETRSFTVDGPITEATALDVVVAATDQSGATETTLVRIVLSPPPPVVAAIATPIQEGEGVQEVVEETVEEEPVLAAAETAEIIEDIVEVEAPQSVAPLVEEITVARRDIDITEPESLVSSAPKVVEKGAVPVPETETLEDADTQSLELLFTLVDEEVAQSFANLTDLMDQQREEANQDTRFARQVVGSSAAITSGFSVGYILWLVRGGTLIGSVLSALPAWRFIDPLPILDSLDGEDGEGDGESLEQIVDSEKTDPSSGPEQPPQQPPEQPTGKPGDSAPTS